jgi:hypothetical protein
MASNGYQLPYDHLPPTMNMDMPLVPLTYTAIGSGEEFESNFVHKFEYPPEPVAQQLPQPQQRRPSKSRARAKTLPTPPDNNTDSSGLLMLVNDPNSLGHFNSPIVPNTVEVKTESPKSRPNPRGRGRGTIEAERKGAPKTGKGRGSTQGVVIPISHQARNEALAEQALKRKRLDGDELQDDTEERKLLDFLDPGGASPQKKVKSKKDHHACDRCFRNKTKVFIASISLTKVPSSD